MASITIRNLDPAIKARLRVRAAVHGRSMEDEARDILRVALAEAASAAPSLARAISQRFRGLNADELELPTREPLRDPPHLDR